jgi:hypothetical protein
MKNLATDIVEKGGDIHTDKNLHGFTNIIAAHTSAHHTQLKHHTAAPQHNMSINIDQIHQRRT